MIFLTLLAIPLIVALVFLALGGSRITFREFMIHVGAQLLIAGASVAFLYWQDTADSEVWNGRIILKKRETVSCQHSYSCNCSQVCSGSGKTRTCSTICHTCYEHVHDYDWMAYTSNREGIEIARIDSQGVDQPPRWTAIRIGEPTAVKHSYTNYIKASPDTLFRHQGLVEEFKDRLPAYPGHVYDYYRLNRVIGQVVQPEKWNQGLTELNSDLGAVKQVNAILVIARDTQPEYAEALEQYWIGGKKNDVITIIGANKEDGIDWVHVSAWTDSEMLKVKIRDEVLAVGKLDRDAIFGVLREDISKYYVRKPMKDFKYLAASITPTRTEWIVSMLIGILTSIGLGIFFWENEVA